MPLFNLLPPLWLLEKTNTPSPQTNKKPYCTPTIKTTKESSEISPCGKCNSCSLICKAETCKKILSGLLWNFGWCTQTGMLMVTVGEGWDDGLPEECLMKRKRWPGWPSQQRQKPEGKAGMPSQCRMGNYQTSKATSVGRKPWTMDSWYIHPLHEQLDLSLINLWMYLTAQGQKKVSWSPVYP